MNPLTSWLQTRLISVDRGRCGWSMDEGGLLGSLPGMDVAAPVAAPDPSSMRRLQAVRGRSSIELCRSRSPPIDLLQLRWRRLAADEYCPQVGQEGRWWRWASPIRPVLLAHPFVPVNPIKVLSLITPQCQHRVGLFIPKPSRGAGCQHFGMSDLGTAVRQRPSLSVAIVTDLVTQLFARRRTVLP